MPKHIVGTRFTVYDINHSVNRIAHLEVGRYALIVYPEWDTSNNHSDVIHLIYRTSERYVPFLSSSNAYSIQYNPDIQNGTRCLILPVGENVTLTLGDSSDASY